jgi:hypothetical protein
VDWRHGSLLVVGSAADGPDAGHHQHEIGTALLAQGRDLERRTDHAIEAVGVRQVGQAQHLIGRVGMDTRGLEVGTVE